MIKPHQIPSDLQEAMRIRNERAQEIARILWENRPDLSGIHEIQRQRAKELSKIMERRLARLPDFTRTQCP